MRIEKISDKQIRCTLTQADLQNHHINIGELAYGSEKARSLFQEMLSQASREFNFHAENMPLMIEAVPMSGDNLVLVITKVEEFQMKLILVFPNFHHIRIMLRQNHFNLTEQTTLLISSRKYVRQK